MKSVMLILIFIFSVAVSSAQKNKANNSVADSTKKTEVVETACGQCQFHLPGTGCNLAVRIKGKAYFVDGTNIDSHGDAHAQQGFCNAISKAEVQGTIVNNRFNVTYFKLLEPVKTTNKN